MIPDDGPTYTNSLTEGQKPVEVGVKNLTDYAGHVFKIYMNSQAATAKAFAHIPTLLSQGLTMPNDGVDALAEGKMAHQMMAQRIDDFRAFLGEMNNGVRAIAYASQVVAYTFDDTDGENGANINDIAFAFADDGAGMPAGYDTRLLLDGGKTMEQQQAEFAAQNGGNQGSSAGLYGDTSGATVSYSTPYSTGYSWPDGSRMTASYSSETTRTPDGFMTVYITTYTVYDKEGKVVGHRVERSSSSPDGGSTSESTEISAGDTSSRTSTTTYSDGHVSTSSTTTQPGADGEPVTTSTSHETRPEDSSGSTGDEGPVEAAQDRYDTKGTQESQQQYGMGY